jgi:restriction system protein
MQDRQISITPHFPTYEQTRLLLPLFDQVQISVAKDLINTVREQTGTPQNPVDWSDPDSWIQEKLSGTIAELAKKIWEESDHKVNPRYIEGINWLIVRHELAISENGKFKITEKGRQFVNHDSTTIKEIDSIEGVTYLLSLIATKTRAQRKDLLPDWSAFLSKYTKYSSMAAITDTLWQRLRNLKDRGFINKEGIYYAITEQGSDYAEKVITTEPDRKVFQSISSFNDNQKKKMRNILAEMNPYQFEHLVRDLLEAMGYEDVIVTSQSGDKGVDVVANIQFGITDITEVVQVKRHKGNIGRQTIDQLRGALPYHRAIRGTLITLSDFTQGSKDAAIFSGAAPITLIDGDRLIDLLFEHEIGITKKSVDLFMVDEDFFNEPTERFVLSPEIDEE